VQAWKSDVKLTSLRRGGLYLFVLHRQKKSKSYFDGDEDDDNDYNDGRFIKIWIFTCFEVKYYIYKQITT